MGSEIIRNRHTTHASRRRHGEGSRGLSVPRGGPDGASDVSGDRGHGLGAGGGGHAVHERREGEKELASG
eukprot:1371452-Amorphochlora_amoeboformis.AAC.2